jgi:hypothetical protein
MIRLQQYLTVGNNISETWGLHHLQYSTSAIALVRNPDLGPHPTGLGSTLRDAIQLEGFRNRGKTKVRECGWDPQLASGVGIPRHRDGNIGVDVPATGAKLRGVIANRSS